MAGQQKIPKVNKPIFDLKINKSEVIAEKMNKLGHITWALEVCSKKKKTSAQYQIANRDYEIWSVSKMLNQNFRSILFNASDNVYENYSAGIMRNAYGFKGPACKGNEKVLENWNKETGILIKEILDYFFIENISDEDVRFEKLTRFKEKLEEKKESNLASFNNKKLVFKYYFLYSEELIGGSQIVQASESHEVLEESVAKISTEQMSDEEKKKAEEQRIAEEKKKAEEQRIAEEKKKAEIKKSIELFYNELDLNEVLINDMVYLVNTSSKKFIKSLDGSYVVVGDNKSLNACSFAVYHSDEQRDFSIESVYNVETNIIKANLEATDNNYLYRCENFSEFSSFDIIILNKQAFRLKQLQGQEKYSDFLLNLDLDNFVDNFDVFYIDSYEIYLAKIDEIEKTITQKTNSNLEIIISKNNRHFTYIATNLENRNICINSDRKDSEQLLEFILSKNFTDDYYNFPGEGTFTWYTYPIDEIFLNLKTDKCGYVLSDGKELNLIYEAFNRDGVKFEITPGGFKKKTFDEYKEINQKVELNTDEVNDTDTKEKENSKKRR